MARLSFHMGRWIHHGGWFPDWQTRLFDRKKGNWNQSLVHERVDLDGEVGRIRQPILHWVFADLTDQIQTNNKYSSLGAEELFRKGDRFSFAKLLLKPIFKFLETYVWKRGFMDGLPGF